ncbi:MAG: NAD(+) synthase [Flavobacteriaceae bacterium]
MNLSKVNQHIVQWLKEYKENSGVSGFVVGVSGGIDSAVTSTLCAQTGFPVLCVEMPIHQASSQVSRAQEHIEHLKNTYDNVSSIRVDLSQTFDSFINMVPKGNSPELTSLSQANTRARIRMTTLYYLAGIHGRLVAGTGNKVEDFGVGFYTKYGDGGVDLSPIADLYKSEVFALGALLNVPESILNAAPTDGLFGDSRTDEDQIGASYDELEWAMKMQDLNKTTQDFQGREREVFEIYLKRNQANKHKMNPIPVCLIPLEYQ